MACHFEKGFRTGAEQQTVEDLLILQHQRSQPMGQCEDHVQILGREKFSSTCSDLAVPSSDLTLRAMAIAAAVIRDGGTMSAAGALIEMPAECGGTTPANGQQHFDMLPTEPVAISCDEGISRGADQIGHLEWWPGHLVLLRRRTFERQ